MSYRRLWVAATCSVALVAIVLLGQRSDANDNAANRGAPQLQQLQDRLAKLEARVAELEKRPAYVTVPKVPGPPSLQAVPKHWQPREFNGMPYYIVPLDVGRKQP
jgi:hypothetical protein